MFVVKYYVKYCVTLDDIYLYEMCFRPGISIFIYVMFTAMVEHA